MVEEEIVTQRFNQHEFDKLREIMEDRGPGRAEVHGVAKKLTE